MWRLLAAIIGLSVLGWFVNTFSPITVTNIIVFFCIVAGTTYAASLLLFKIVRRAVLITLGVITILALRLLGLREIWYILLLVPILISLEILYRKR